MVSVPLLARVTPLAGAVQVGGRRTTLIWNCSEIGRHPLFTSIARRKLIPSDAVAQFVVDGNIQLSFVYQSIGMDYGIFEVKVPVDYSGADTVGDEIGHVPLP